MTLKGIAGSGCFTDESHIGATPPQSLCMKEWKRMGRKTWGNRPGLH